MSNDLFSLEENKINEFLSVLCCISICQWKDVLWFSMCHVSQLKYNINKIIINFANYQHLHLTCDG